MDDQRQNPYLVLGIDYGTDPATARRAWMRRVRSVRRDTKSPYTDADLNAALDRIEHPQEDPAVAERWLRVPAVNLQPSTGAPGSLFHPAPIAMARRTSSPSPDDLTALRNAVACSISAWLLDHCAPRPNTEPYAPPRDGRSGVGAP